MNNNKLKILSLFDKKERKKVWLPDEIAKGEIDISKRKVTTWIHKSGHLAYVIYNSNGDFYAFMFDRFVHSYGFPSMCDWCHSIKPLNLMGAFRFQLDKKTSLTITICSDLNCIESIKNPNHYTMRETLTINEKIERYYRNIENYIYRYILDKKMLQK